jgi:hypothetical protein
MIFFSPLTGNFFNHSVVIWPVQTVVNGTSPAHSVSPPHQCGQRDGANLTSS